jgi:hypothetical protein
MVILLPIVSCRAEITAVYHQAQLRATLFRQSVVMVFEGMGEIGIFHTFGRVGSGQNM